MNIEEAWRYLLSHTGEDLLTGDGKYQFSAFGDEVRFHTEDDIEETCINGFDNFKRLFDGMTFEENNNFYF